MKIGSLAIKKEGDIVKVRQAVKHLCFWLDFDRMEGIRVATAASELTRTLLEYVSGGEVTLELKQSKKLSALKLVFEGKSSDSKKIKELVEFGGSQGVESGISSAKKLMDEFKIDKPTGKGILITLTKQMPVGKDFSKKTINKIKDDFTGLSEESALESLKSQNEELVEVLDQLKEKNTQLENLNYELEASNKSIIQLYHELDLKNEELDRKSENKTRFLRAFGHETRTPINSVLTLAKLLEKRMDGELTSGQEKQVRMIRESAEHMLSVVSGLLDLSRIEAGIMEVKSRQFIVKDLFNNVSSTVAPLAEEKGLALTLECKKGLPELNTDIKLITQVLLNLLGNAIKYSEKGEIVALAEPVSRGNGAEAVKFSVSDTGIGIREDKIETIFEEFKQVHDKHYKSKGTGLGLSIAKTIVRRLGGSGIEVKSEIGKGSTFSFTLPLKFSSKPTAKSILGQSGLEMDGDTVLVIEDDEKMIYYLRTILEKEGYQVSAARTAQRAIEMAQKLLPAVILLDIKLPDEDDGWRVLKVLKREIKTKHIPVAVITVLHDAEDKATVLGADEYLSKPIKKENLIALLRRYEKVKEIKTILIVDDEEAEIMGLEAMLREHYQILTARDGQEAMDVLETEKPDLIILDLIMPVMDGFEFLLLRKKQPQILEIPVVVYSTKELDAYEQSIVDKETIMMINKDRTDIEVFPEKMRSIFKKLEKAEQ
jgi:signal transduction histidine kinase/CheY-like chemotaxis protein